MIYFYISIIFFSISILTAKYKSRHFFHSIINTSSVFVYLILTILYFSANYFTNEGINDAVLYTVQYGLGGAGFGEYALLISISIFFFVITFAFSYMYFRVINNTVYPRPKKLKGFIHYTFLVLAFLFHPFVWDSYAIYQVHNPNVSYDFDQYYKKPITTRTKTDGLNIVYIYAESLERTYFNEQIFPNLTINLKQLQKQSIDFTNIKQIPGTGWTVGGMVASQCSIPLFMASGGNSMGNIDTFLSGAECTGDILADLGYKLIYLQGSSTYFSGIDHFYKSHGFNEIYGRDNLVRQLEDKSYVNGWGLYDDTLFDIAFKKFKKLSKEGKKFGLFMATIDTHHPNGHPSKSCKDIPYNNGENSILNAVHCSDYLISKFIKKIQASPYNTKTLIVLTSDHLAMSNTASNLLLKGERRDLFLLFDPRNKKYLPIDKKGSMLDVAPTVLAKLGIDTDLGLGRNLFAKDSLFSSFDNFEKKLLSWRDNILAFWQFPKMTTYYDVNISEWKVNIVNHSYKFPVLFKISESKEIEPIFEVNSGKRLIESLRAFEPKQKFIWIDNCSRIDYLIDTESTHQFCIAQGSLSGNIETMDLKNNTLTLKADNLFVKSNVNMKQYYHRMKRIKKYTSGISITSSEVSTSKRINSRIEVGSKRLELSRGLNVLAVDSKGNYTVEHFNTNKSKKVADKFLIRIESLIKKGEFFAIVSHDVIKTNYPKFKEKLNKLSLKLLQTLNGRVAYIAYGGADHTIKEYTSKTSVSQTIMFDPRKKKLLIAEKGNDKNRFIAHAGGAIDNNTYTNSLEALNHNYKKGFRLFEMDIIKTSDNIYVAFHGWKRWQRMLKYQGKIPPTKEIFKSYKIEGKYTPMDISDINRWFESHPDTILITDKVNNPKEFSKAFTDKDRLRMELFSWKAVYEAQSLGVAAIPTGDILHTIPGDKITFLKKHNIEYVAASRRMLNDHFSLISILTNAGIKIYAFHINLDKGIDEIYVVCNELNYFYGLYANNWDFRNSFELSECLPKDINSSASILTGSDHHE